MSEIPASWLPMLTWPYFYYRQQLDYYFSEAWQTWLIGGNGCFGKGTEVLMYDGSIQTVENIQVGDWLMGDDSTPREVLRVIRGHEPLYRLKLKSRHGDGQEYIFNENHVLYLESDEYKEPEVEVTIKDYLKWTPRKKRSYKFAKRGVDFAYLRNRYEIFLEPLLIPPYILGAWLGDGDSNGRRFSNVDKAVISEFEYFIRVLGCSFTKSDKWHYQIVGINNGNKTNAFCKLLEHYNLKNNKHIPDRYLFETKENRLELLAGLIDTDGNYHNRKHTFYQSNRSMAEQVLFLARSLGINANISERKRKGVENTQYCVTLCRNTEQIPCRIKRKQHKGENGKALRFGVESVEPIGDGNFYGFTLTGNGRFLGADFSVLRNTGKSLLVYNTLALQMYGIHYRQIGDVPIKIKVLVPSFDYVKDVALEKLTSPQRIIFTKLTDTQKGWIEVCKKAGIVKAYADPENGKEGYFELPQMIPQEDIRVDYSREHKGLEIANGSSIWFVTSEQGWRFQRGGECDILSCDEEGDERVWDELKRGLRNAKGGGKIYAGMTPPYEEGQGPTWTKEKIMEASFTDPSINVIHSCMADNPAITPEFIEEFKKGKTQKQIDVQIYGRYPTWGDLVHPDFQDFLWEPSKCQGHLISNDSPMPDNNDVDWVMAFDWHQSKPCAAVFGWIDRGGNFTVFDELDTEVAREKEIGELAEIFKAIEGEPFSKRRFRRWQDPSAKSKFHAVQRGFNAWTAFRQHGIVTSAGKNRDPSVGISIVNEYFKGNGKDHPRIFIYERCANLRRYLKNHYWKRGEDGVGKPDAKWSDYPITLRYILEDIGFHKGAKHNWPLQSFKKRKEQRITYDLGAWI